MYDKIIFHKVTEGTKWVVEEVACYQEERRHHLYQCTSPSNAILHLTLPFIVVLLVRTCFEQKLLKKEKNDSTILLPGPWWRATTYGNFCDKHPSFFNLESEPKKFGV